MATNKGTLYSTGVSQTGESTPFTGAGTLAAPTSLKLIYTPAAANTNFLGAGSMFHFFAPVDGEWLVQIWCIPEGTGATGVLTTAAS